MNKDNKSLVIILYIIMLIIAIGGPIIAINQQLNEDIVEKDDKQEIDKDEERPTPEKPDPSKPEVETPLYPKPEEPNDEDELPTNLDEYLVEYPFTVDQEDRKKLINSTNINNCMSEEIYGGMLKDEISNDYKLIYTANQLIRHLGEKVENQLFYGELTISEQVLLDNAKKIFTDVKIPENYSSELSYYGTYKIRCNNVTCTFNQDTFGAIGISPINGYETKIVETPNELIVKYFYIEEKMLDYNHETNIYTVNIKLYDKKNGTLLKEFENYIMDLNEDINVYETFSKYLEEVNELTYTFDNQNRLVSVTKSR